VYVFTKIYGWGELDYKRLRISWSSVTLGMDCEEGGKMGEERARAEYT
jgi:hypothetical protein